MCRSLISEEQSLLSCCFDFSFEFRLTISKTNRFVVSDIHYWHRLNKSLVNLNRQISFGAFRQQLLRFQIDI